MTILSRSLFRALRAGLAALTGCAALLGATAAQAQINGVGCIMFEHWKHQGRQVNMRPGQKIPRFGPVWNDRVSSVKVAPGCRLEAYQHWDFRGFVASFDRDAGFVGAQLNDQFSSAACSCRRAQSPEPRPRRPIQVPGGLAASGGPAPRPTADRFACVVHEENGYRGAWRAFERGRDSHPLGRNLRGKVDSIAVARGCFAVLDYGRDWKVYFDKSVSDLPRVFREGAAAVRCGCRGRP